MLPVESQTPLGDWCMALRAPLHRGQRLRRDASRLYMIWRQKRNSGPEFRNLCVCVCIGKSNHVYEIPVCIYLYTCIPVYMYVCICIPGVRFTNTHTHADSGIPVRNSAFESDPFKSGGRTPWRLQFANPADSFPNSWPPPQKSLPYSPRT